MTQQQTAEIIKAIGTFYPSFLANVSADEMKLRIKFWHIVLQKYDYAAIANAVIDFVKHDTKGFPPVIGQLLANTEATESTILQLDTDYFNRATLWLDDYTERRRMLE